jgi:hypothetical protein
MDDYYTSEYLSKAVLKQNWKATINALFGEDPLFPRYYRACINKNFKDAKKFLSEGDFAENTYMWDIFAGHDCCMNGCLDLYRVAPITWLSYNSKLTDDLVKLGLVFEN